MKITLALVLLLCAAPQSQAYQRQGDRSILQGRVTDQSGCPIPGVSITIELLSGARLAATNTDEKGDYRMEVNHRGLVRLRAEALGFERAVADRSLSDGVNLWDVDISLGHIADPPMVQIDGVVKADGSPLQDATITLMTVTGTQVRRQTRTDGDGRFRMPWVYPGQYVLVATKPCHDPVSTVVISRIGGKTFQVTLALQRHSFCDPAKK